MDSSSKFFFSFSVNYVMIIKLVNLIVLLGSKLLNHFRKIFNISMSEQKRQGYGWTKKTLRTRLDIQPNIRALVYLFPKRSKYIVYKLK